MNAIEHEDFLEFLQQIFPLADMFPKMLQVYVQGLPVCVRVNHADVIDRLQLAKVSD